MEICLEDVSYKSGKVFICQNIAWKLSQGEHWVLFGENGSGKTTLLSLVAGYHSIKKGTIFLDGEAYSEELLPKIKKNIALVSSSFFNNYYHNETLLEIVLSGGESGLGLGDKIIPQKVVRAKHLLAALGLKNRYSHPFCYLSKGQQQCVLIARALLNKPKLLLLDEIYSGLDAVMKKYVADSLKDICTEENVGTIMVTHEVENITDEYTHILLLKKGKVFARGLLKETMTSAVLSNYFQCSVDVTWQDGHFGMDIKINKQSLAEFYKKEI